MFILAQTVKYSWLSRLHCLSSCWAWCLMPAFPLPHLLYNNWVCFDCMISIWLCLIWLHDFPQVVVLISQTLPTILFPSGGFLLDFEMFGQVISIQSWDLPHQPKVMSAGCLFSLSPFAWWHFVLSFGSMCWKYIEWHHHLTSVNKSLSLASRLTGPGENMFHHRSKGAQARNSKQ